MPHPTSALALLVTCAAAIVLSPIQDHVRKMLHIATLSWRAASVSVVQFLAVAAGVGVAIALDVPIAWVPFGVLAFANAVSLTFARVVSHLSSHGQPPEQLRFRSLATKGKWLVLHAAAPAVSGFALAAIIAGLASPEELGYAESARVVAQPVLVLSAGLTAVLGPRSMRAAMETDVGTARHTNRVYLLVMAFGALAYAAVAGWDWALNPMTFIVPSAFIVSGLVAVTVLANFIMSAVFLQVNELLGAARERKLALIAWIEAPIEVAIAFSAGITGAFARPLAYIGASGARYGMQARALAVGLRLAAGPSVVGCGSAVASEGDRVGLDHTDGGEVGVRLDPLVPHGVHDRRPRRRRRMLGDLPPEVRVGVPHLGERVPIEDADERTIGVEALPRQRRCLLPLVDRIVGHPGGEEVLEDPLGPQADRRTSR